MQNVRHDPQKPKAPGKNNELILGTELVEEVLLVFLAALTVSDRLDLQGVILTSGSDSFTGGFSSCAGITNEPSQYKIITKH